MWVLSLLFSLILVGIGAAIAYALDLFFVAAVAFGVQWLVFCVYAWPQQSEKIYDLTGGWTFIGCVALSLGTAEHFRVKNIVLSSFVAIWALRLSTFLFMRIQHDRTDPRFDRLRNRPLAFLVAWNFQGLWAFVTALPVFVVNRESNSLPSHVEWNDILGWSLWVFGFIFEVIADRQKSAFNKTHKGHWIDTGLWRFSRHPNYFGEIVLWIGISVSAVSIFEKEMYLALLSPVIVTVLLTMVSGIPMVEKSSDKKWGHDTEYQKYKKSVSVLIPLPRRDSNA